MKSLQLILLFGIFSGQITAQYSSMNIRRADGKGPYPIYLTLQTSYASNKNLFQEFTDDYREAYDIENSKRYMHGIEVNAGVVINERNFLGVRGWVVNGIAVEMGYRNISRNLKKEYELSDQTTATRRLHYQTETFSLRLSKRFSIPEIHITYPLTLQVQAGPTLYNFYSVRESPSDNSSSIRVHEGYSIFGVGSKSRIVSGIDTRIRFMFFDSAGTAGGVGYYVEYRYLWTIGDRDLSPLYDTFLDYQKHVVKHWDYASLTVGVVAPLAIRVVSSE